MRFRGKRAVVTGGASGIGEAVVRGLAADGAAFVGIVDQDEARARNLASELHVAATFVCDIADAEQTAAVWAQIGAAGPIDILITAAAILGPVAGVAECAVEDWDRVFAVNVRGTYLAVRHAIPLLKQRGGGAIVTISSAGGLIATPALGPYGGSKAAVIQITRSLAVAHAGDRVRVNCVCPGPIDTPMLQERLVDPRDIEKVKSRVRLNRFGRPAEIAEAVLFFASDASSFATGSTLLVDGGELA